MTNKRDVILPGHLDAVFLDLPWKSRLQFAEPERVLTALFLSKDSGEESD
jgi:hypothetical protein